MTPRRPRSALVTGASGFIGGHVAERLLAEGVRVRALVRDPTRGAWLARQGAELCAGAITDPAVVDAAVRDVDTVFHLAAVVGPAALPLASFEAINAGGTRLVMDACRRCRSIERVVHVSSVAVTGGAPPGAAVTEDTPASPVTRYGITKWRAEQAAGDAARAELPVAIVRPAWVYGARSPGAIKLFQRIAARRMVLVGRARNTMQPVSVEDVVDALWLAATVPGIEGRTYQVAGPEPITSGDFCGEVARALGVPPPSLRVPMPAAMAAARLCEWLYPLRLGKPPIDRGKLGFFVNDQHHSTERAARDLGWRARIGVGEGIRRAVRDMRALGLVPPRIE